MDKSSTIQEIYNVCKKFEEMRLFGKKMPFNNSELLMIKQIIVASKRGERLISSELAKRLGITRSAVSQMVNKLEEKGTLRRVPDKIDRKIAYVELSENTLKIYERMCNETSYFFTKLIERIGENEMDNFLRVANIFLDALSDVKCEYLTYKEKGFVE